MLPWKMRLTWGYTEDREIVLLPLWADKLHPIQWRPLDRSNAEGLVREVSLRSRLVWLVVFGVAFGYLEAAVVVYLRELYYPAGFGFPLAIPEPRVLLVELGRELATLVMIWGVAMLAGRSGWVRFGAFCILFGVWDIVFYLVLYFVLGWPESLMTWDVLFLVPLAWAGPVLTPVLVAVGLVVAGGMMMSRVEAGYRPLTRWWIWGGAFLSLLLLLVAFMANHGLIQANQVPTRFPWIPYLGGLVLGWGIFWVAFFARAEGGESATSGEKL